MDRPNSSGETPSIPACPPSSSALERGRSVKGESIIKAGTGTPTGTSREQGIFMGVPLEELRESARRARRKQSEWSIDDFVVLPRGGVFRRSPSREEFMRWTSHRLHWPMTHIDKPLVKGALKCFRDLQRIMGDRSYGPKRQKKGQQLCPGNSDPCAVYCICEHPRLLDFETILENVDIGLREPAMRDELYLQLLKQITHNPSPTSLLRGWEVLCVYSRCFPPSKRLLPVFLEHLQEYHVELTMEEREEICAHAEGPPQDANCLRKRISLMLKYVGNRLEKLGRTGPRGHLPTLEDIANTFTLPFRHQVFGVTLFELMEYAENRDETGHYPRILTFLAESVLRLKGTAVEGIFRVPGVVSDIQMLRLRIEKGIYSIDGIRDPSVPASLLKQWLREMAEPVIPPDFYEQCLMVGSDVDEAIRILDELPELNRMTLKYIIKFLQVIGSPRYQPQTKMTISNLAMVFAPNVLRCPSDNPLVILANSKFEQSFLRILINYLE